MLIIRILSKKPCPKPSLKYPSIIMSKLYKGFVGALDKFVPEKARPLWEHPAGPKTIFFWAPLCKWCLVIAGLGDLARPPEKLSVAQFSALAVTGLIWSRYSVVIIPKNWSLFSVNILVFLTSSCQVGRALRHNYLQKEKDAKDTKKKK